MNCLRWLCLTLAAAAAEDRAQDTIAALARALEDGSRSVEEILLDPRHMALHGEAAFKALVRRHAPASRLRLTNDGEPGDPIVVAGTLRASDGRPVSGALVHAFHADARGNYTPEGPMDEPRARLFGFLRTGPDGRFEVRTIYPGPYPERDGVEGPARFIPRHVHFEIEAEGFARRRCQMVFDDDPRMEPGYWKEWAAKDRNPIAKVSGGEGGVRRCEVEVVLDPTRARRTGLNPAGPEDLYRRAAARTEEGDAGAALALLRASFEAGLASPSRVLTDPAFRALRGRETRPSLRDLLREFARESSVVLAPADEPGDPLVVSGTLRDPEGRPVSGALLYVFHTDSKGLYSEDGVDESNPRLFGFVRTGLDGAYRYRTIRPGHYPDEKEPVEQHVHVEVSAEGFATRGHRLGFRDDPFWERHGRTPPAWAVPVARDAEGAPYCVDDLVLAPR